MANLAKERATTKNALATLREQLVGNALAATKYYAGLIGIIDDNQRVVNPGAGNAALAGARAGVIKLTVDNTLGGNDAVKVELETGVFNFDKHGVNPPLVVGSIAYASDNHTISRDPADGPAVGRVWAIHAASVDVSFGPLAA